MTVEPTCNFIGPSTQYQNGIDGHVDRGVSQFLIKQFQIYIYSAGAPKAEVSDCW